LSEHNPKNEPDASTDEYVVGFYSGSYTYPVPSPCTAIIRCHYAKWPEGLL